MDPTAVFRPVIGQDDGGSEGHVVRVDLDEKPDRLDQLLDVASGELGATPSGERVAGVGPHDQPDGVVRVGAARWHEVTRCG